VISGEPIQVDSASSDESRQGGRETSRVARTGLQFSIRLRNWLGALITCRVPIGYEDETGFHYGTQQGSRESI
jgi:hypothetical protein